MKTFKQVIYCSAFLILCGCVAHNSFITDQKDAWISDPDKGLFYCRANAKDSGSADPICFEAGFQKYEERENFSSNEQKEQTKKKLTSKYKR